MSGLTAGVVVESQLIVGILDGNDPVPTKDQAIGDRSAAAGAGHGPE